MSLVRSIFGTQFSQKQGQITLNNNKKCLPRRFKCGFEGSPSRSDNKRREKHTPDIKAALKTQKKNNMQANKPYILTGLRHIFAIVSSQISTMMEPSNAILEHETTIRRYKISPRDISLLSSLPIFHVCSNGGFWKRYILHPLKPYGGFFFFKCNYDIRDYPNLPQFHSELLQWWSEFREMSASEKDWVHVIWNNKDIRIDKKPFFSQKLIFEICNCI